MNKNGRRVWVLYHWLGHYRQAVCEELVNNSPNHYEFWGSTNSYGQGIKTVTDLPEGRFRPTKLFPAGGFYIQPAAVWHALFGKYDDTVIHAGGRWPTMWLAALIARLRGKRVYYWIQGWTRRDTKRTTLLKRCYYNIAHGLMLYGHYGKCLGIESGFAPEKMHVIYNSLDVEKQIRSMDGITPESRAALRRALFPGREHVPIVSTVSRLTSPKKLELLVDACAQLESEGTPVNLLVAGDGVLRDDLERRARHAGLSANFLGAVYEEERIAALMDASAVGVIPGPIGLFVMHAMVFGTPVVSNDQFEGQGPEFEAIIPGVTGGYYRDNDVSDLAREIRHWIERADEREQTRQAAQERITQFYHPRTQRAIIDRAISGQKADDSVMAAWNRDRFLSE